MRLHHVQVSCPLGGEDGARQFYGDVLGLPEVDKPPALAARGGCWFRRGDVEETLLHELVHLAIGAAPGGRRWHGTEFTDTLRRAMLEGYGVAGARVRNTYHGAYAAALERSHAAEARLAERGVHPEQLELTG